MNQKLELLKAYTQAWNDHDIDAIMSMMTNDCVFYAIAGNEVEGTTHQGHEKVRVAFESAWKNFPDAAWLDGDFYMLDANHAVSTSRFKGTDLHGGMHEALMVDLFTFEGDKIAIKNAFRKNRPPVTSGE